MTDDILTINERLEAKGFTISKFAYSNAISYTVKS